MQTTIEKPEDSYVPGPTIDPYGTVRAPPERIQALISLVRTKRYAILQTFSRQICAPCGCQRAYHQRANTRDCFDLA